MLLGVLLVQFPNYTKKWEGSDVPGHSFAKFEDFNGKQDFKIKLDKKDSFVFNYKTDVKAGTLHLDVKSLGKTVLAKDLKGSESGELKIVNTRGENYKFIFKAKHANGSFDITYKKI
jgi:hypothetical protein